ncbi:MAG: ABC transporter substrate-binding protein [Hydrogenophaga sp.]|nr:ABC transporter substrate-binding protein [Hydrogenophaga sp.]
MLRRRFLARVLASPAALAAPVVWGQTRLVPIKFTLDFRVTGQTAPFFLAQQRGYYAAEGLDVQIDVGAGSVASITRIVSGAYQMGLGDISSLIEFQAANGGTPAVQAVYQYYNRAPFAIIGRRDRGITDFRSLQGKKVAAAAVESTRRAWPMVARRLRVGDGFFQWSTTDYSARDNVMVRGDVDAATYFHDSAVSLFARMKPDDLAVLKYTDAGVNLYGNAILAGNGLITQQPGAVAGFLRATNRAIQESLADPVAAVAAAKAREPILNDAVELERWGITREYVAAADTRTHGLGDVLKRTLEMQVDEVTDAFQLKTRPGVEGLFHRGFLPPAAERSVKA